jgi:hypothetical protein
MQEDQMSPKKRWLTIAGVLGGGFLLLGVASYGAKRRERIAGGLAPGGRCPKNTLSSELRKGIEVEMEHTTSRAIAREIACDHLTEDRHYYTKLATIEKPHEFRGASNDPLKKILPRDVFLGVERAGPPTGGSAKVFVYFPTKGMLRALKLGLIEIAETNKEGISSYRRTALGQQKYEEYEKVRKYWK